MSRSLMRQVAGVRWLSDSSSDDEARWTAREVVGLLLEVPVAPGDRRLALHAPDRDVVSVAQLPEPLTYQPVAGEVPRLPPLKSPARASRRKARALPARAANLNRMYDEQEAIGDGALADAGQLPARRPGSGGRQRPLQIYTQTTATAKLYERYGEPIVSRHGDALMQVWIIDPEGEGIIGARLSTRDVQNGETALEQVHPALAQAERLGLRPRLIVVTTENSGGLRYDERCDFELIEREIFAKRCRWVWFRDVRRLIRNVSPFYRLRDTLLDTGTDLWLTEYAGSGKPVDWDDDDIRLGFDAIIAERDRKSIYKQTHGPLMTRWLAEGRGWPGAKRFGFRRNPLTKFPEVDPEQWPFVRMIYETYVAAGADKAGADKAGADQKERADKEGDKKASGAKKGTVEGTGMRAVQAVLRAAGCPLSLGSIKRILGDPIYLTGEYTVERDGITYACRPIHLPDPIPADLFAKVVELRRIRAGKETRNPAGFFCLNGIVEHACGCRLRARVKTEKHPLRYQHYSQNGDPVPDDCRGWAVDARELERAVVHELRRLAKCQRLQEEWASLARPYFAEPEALLDDSRREELIAQIAKLERMQAALEQDFVRKIATGEQEGSVDQVLADFHRVTGGVSSELKQARERLAHLEVLDNVRRSTRPKESDPLLDVFLSVVTEELPDDPQLVRRRAAILKTVLSKVIVHDLDDGRIEIELHGPLVPDDVPPLRPYGPTMVAHEELLGIVRGENATPYRGASQRRIDEARWAARDGTMGAEVGRKDEAGSEADHAFSKGWLTGQLVPTLELPRLQRPGRSSRQRQSAPGAPLVPVWLSPRIAVGVRRPVRADH